MRNWLTIINHEQVSTISKYLDDYFLKPLAAVPLSHVDCPVTLLVCSKASQIEDFLRSELNRESDRKVLFLLADEKLSFSSKYLGFFDLVFANHYSPWITRKNVFWIPNGTIFGKQHPAKLEADSRPNVRSFRWSFVGATKNDRRRIIRIFEKVQPGFHFLSSGWMTDDGISSDYLAQIYTKSMAVVAPSGNVHPYTYRVFESLQFGSVPVVKKYLGVDWNERVFGKHPFIAVHSWRAGARLIKAMPDKDLLNKAKLCSDWFASFETQLTDNFVQLVLGKREENPNDLWPANGGPITRRLGEMAFFASALSIEHVRRIFGKLSRSGWSLATK